MAEANVTPEAAREAVLGGRTVCVVGGSDAEDPTSLHYLDRCYECDGEPMIYTESIGGWSAGVKEAVCEPHSDFYIEFVSEPPPLSMTISDEKPPQRESPCPVRVASALGEERG